MSSAWHPGTWVNWVSCLVNQLLFCVWKESGFLTVAGGTASQFLRTWIASLQVWRGKRNMLQYILSFKKVWNNFDISYLQSSSEAAFDTICKLLFQFDQLLVFIYFWIQPTMWRTVYMPIVKGGICHFKFPGVSLGMVTVLKGIDGKSLVGISSFFNLWSWHISNFVSHIRIL